MQTCYETLPSNKYKVRLDTHILTPPLISTSVVVVEGIPYKTLLLPATVRLETDWVKEYMSLEDMIDSGVGPQDLAREVKEVTKLNSRTIRWLFPALANVKDETLAQLIYPNALALYLWLITITDQGTLATLGERSLTVWTPDSKLLGVMSDVTVISKTDMPPFSYSNYMSASRRIEGGKCSEFWVSSLMNFLIARDYQDLAMALRAAWWKRTSEKALDRVVQRIITECGMGYTEEESMVSDEELWRMPA